MATQAQRVTELRARRAMADAARGRRPRLQRKVPEQQLPRGEQLRYQRAILAFLAEVEELIRDRVFAKLDRLVAQQQQTDPSARLDQSPAEELDEAFEEIDVEIQQRSRAGGIAAFVAAMVVGVGLFNRRQVERQLSSTLGVGLPQSEPAIPALSSAANRENVRRVRELARTTGNTAAEEASRIIRAGGSPAEARAAIEARFKVSRSRARVIARDQVNKVNAELTRVRQTAAGITSYIWRTVGDDLVRDTHEEFNGRRFTWASGSPEGHPGEPINCRCVAEPVVDDLREAL